MRKLVVNRIMTPLDGVVQATRRPEEDRAGGLLVLGAGTVRAALKRGHSRTFTDVSFRRSAAGWTIPPHAKGP